MSAGARRLPTWRTGWWYCFPDSKRSSLEIPFAAVIDNSDLSIDQTVGRLTALTVAFANDVHGSG